MSDCLDRYLYTYVYSLLFLNSYLACYNYFDNISWSYALSLSSFFCRLVLVAKFVDVVALIADLFCTRAELLGMVAFFGYTFETGLFTLLVASSILLEPDCTTPPPLYVLGITVFYAKLKSI